MLLNPTACLFNRDGVLKVLLNMIILTKKKYMVVNQSQQLYHRLVSETHLNLIIAPTTLPK